MTATQLATNRLGATGLEITRVGLGAWAIGGGGWEHGRALAKPDGPLGSLATELGATPTLLALAWLLRRSPVMLPIPGTSSLEHLEENVAAAGLELSDEQASRLEELS